MSNPSDNHNHNRNHNYGASSSFKHNPGISMEWTPEEQSILEDGLAQYSSETNILRYAKIAMRLQNKTVRDVALRCRWMTKKENSKRRKEEHNLTRKTKEKKERVTDYSTKSSQFVGRPNLPPYATPPFSIDNDDDISYKAIGGSTGELLEENAQVFNQISANLAAYQIQENVALFCQTRDNIFKIMNEYNSLNDWLKDKNKKAKINWYKHSLNDQPEMMKQMPPLPVKVNEELANTILPQTLHMQS